MREMASDDPSLAFRGPRSKVEGGVSLLYLDPQENPLVILTLTPLARMLPHPPSAITCRVILLFLRHPFSDPSYSARSHALHTATFSFSHSQGER